MHTRDLSTVDVAGRRIGPIGRDVSQEVVDRAPGGEALAAWSCSIAARPDRVLLAKSDGLVALVQAATIGRGEVISWEEITAVFVAKSIEGPTFLRILYVHPTRSLCSLKVTMTGGDANELLTLLAQRSIGPGPVQETTTNSSAPDTSQDVQSQLEAIFRWRPGWLPRSPLRFR